MENAELRIIPEEYAIFFVKIMSKDDDKIVAPFAVNSEANGVKKIEPLRNWEANPSGNCPGLVFQRLFRSVEPSIV